MKTLLASLFKSVSTADLFRNNGDGTCTCFEW